MKNLQSIKDYANQDLEEKKTWYGTVAEAYNKSRPSYPPPIINRVLELAKLSEDANILEIGCGTAKATISFAQKGFSMVCLEPNMEMCHLARENCQPYSSIKIINNSFEEWQLETAKFDAVLAATSFHWINPEIGYPKAAEALKDDGYLILLWNTPPQPSYEIYQALIEVYQLYAPSLAKYDDLTTYANNLQEIAEKVINSGHFQGLISEQLIIEMTYSIDDYLLLLSSLSPYIALDKEIRQSLFAGLKKVLEKICPHGLECKHLAAFHLMEKA